MKRTDAINFLSESDLTDRQKDILENHELRKITTIKELAEKYCIEERSILKCKQNALSKLQLIFS